jgi:hypothetical protein
MLNPLLLDTARRGQCAAVKQKRRLWGNRPLALESRLRRAAAEWASVALQVHRSWVAAGRGHGGDAAADSRSCRCASASSIEVNLQTPRGAREVRPNAREMTDDEQGCG